MVLAPKKMNFNYPLQLNSWDSSSLEQITRTKSKAMVPESGELGSVSFGPLSAMAHGPFLKHLPWHGMLWVGRAYSKKCFLARIIYGRVI